MDIHLPVTELKGVGAAVAEKLNRLGITTIDDLLRHYPRRYNDFSKVTSIGSLAPGSATIRGVISRATTRRTRSGSVVTEALISDDSGSVKAVWFNQPYLAKQLPKDTPVYVSGVLEFKYQQYALQNPAVEKVSGFTKDTARIVPLYPETAGLSSKQLRRLLALALGADIPDPLPLTICKQQGLLTRKEALFGVHFPRSSDNLEAARYRIGFEEVYLLQLVAGLRKHELTTLSSPAVSFNETAARKFLDNLSFKFTDDQRKCAWRIVGDLARAHPMNRLLQGDVGSGKTVVAAFAAHQAHLSGLQTALLAPTGILARQHLTTLKAALEPCGVKVGLMVSDMTVAERKDTLERLKSGDINVVVGTHALLEKSVAFNRLGLVVIDEQHRFGVDQRQSLRRVPGKMPHMLSMSATPIPRSLALVAYGDLDISSIRQLPYGRKPVMTEVVTNARMVYAQIHDEIKSGGQVYVVCPLIEDSDKLDAPSVEAETRRLKQYWGDVTIAGLHGRMKPAEKIEVMSRFKEGEVDVLVSTTVVEVGVDVGNASVMLIEGAERFGLATLHQLRGRVGRGSRPSHCYLKTSAGAQAKRRLQLMERYSDGFVLAEADLQLRGAGELYGSRQHGPLDLRMARLDDTAMLAAAKEAASTTADLADYPLLQDEVRRLYAATGTN